MVLGFLGPFVMIVRAMQFAHEIPQGIALMRARSPVAFPATSNTNSRDQTV